MTTFSDYSGTAEEYIAEYLDPDGTLNDTPTTEDEARGIWASLEREFRADGGTGMDEETFVAAVAEMQEAFATTSEPTVTADDGCSLTYSEARVCWEAGEFSEWANEHGFPLVIDGESYTSFSGVEDALSDDTWDDA